MYLSVFAGLALIGCVPTPPPTYEVLFHGRGLVVDSSDQHRRELVGFRSETGYRELELLDFEPECGVALVLSCWEIGIAESWPYEPSFPKAECGQSGHIDDKLFIIGSPDPTAHSLSEVCDLFRSPDKLPETCTSGHCVDEVVVLAPTPTPRLFGAVKHKNNLTKCEFVWGGVEPPTPYEMFAGLFLSLGCAHLGAETTDLARRRDFYVFDSLIVLERAGVAAYPTGHDAETAESIWTRAARESAKAKLWIHIKDTD